MRGGTTTDFWRYNIATDTWESRNSTLAAVVAGGALTYDTGNYIYALKGGASPGVFWRYNIATNSWSAMASLANDCNVAGLAYAYNTTNYNVYAIRGTNQANRWYVYSVPGNSWTEMSSRPQNVGAGTALAYDGSNVMYGYIGGGGNLFYKYTISTGNTGTGTAMATTLTNIGAGGALAHNKNQYIYGFHGGGITNFSRYNIANNTWSVMQNSPSTVNWGGALAYVPANSSWYVSSGTIASQVLDTGKAGSRWDALQWNFTYVADTSISFEARASDTAFTKTASTPSWTPVGGTSPVISGLPKGRYMQWRATLLTSSIVKTPDLQEVTVYYSKAD